MATQATEQEHYEAIQEDTVAGIFQHTAARVPDRVALRTLDGATEITWAEYNERVRRVAAGLASLGVKKGDTVAVMLSNRPEFHVADAGAMHLGATAFSIYNTYTANQIGFLVEDSAPKVAITEQQFLDRLDDVQQRDNALEHIVVVDGDAPEGGMTLEELESRGDDGFDFDAAWQAIESEDILTLIYTSGTTGNPKGVQIMHSNIVQTFRSYSQMVDFPDGGKIVSYLPMAHVAERNVSHYTPMAFGYTVTSIENPRDVMQAVQQVHPTWFFGVPRIWEKLKSGLESMLNGLEDQEQKQKVQDAFDLALKRVDLIQKGEDVPPEIEDRYREADEQVFSNFRAMLGLDELAFCNVGAAPTPPDVIKFFHALGVPLSELWGMSETTGAGTANPPERIRIGTVGPPAPGIEIKLADEDNEILIRGPIVMAGYRNNDEKTRETMTEDGWLMTGDIGEFDEEGYLKIVDRKKELIISAGGKNMSPANIESHLKSAGPLIGQAIAIGDGRPYNVALVTLDPDNLPGFLKQTGIDADPSDLEAIAENAQVVEAVENEVEAANEHMARVEQIKKVTILPTEWEPGGDELTPTMKLKRKPIGEKYSDEIEALYAK
ncbi:MAG TPA: long-chain fatty acid--CoA ligase [Thermoleophilaceae bacterium]|nr:long-chain fatty acid--CoA ligase [Thermoleophilaceae bacterium]